MPKKDLISILDFSIEETKELFFTAYQLKAGGFKRGRLPLAGKSLGMIFQKPSTRTTVSFAVGIYQLGGQPLILNYEAMQLRRGESLADTAQTLSRYLDGIMVRIFAHEDALEISRCAEIPVINGLTDREHPCQVVSDIFTIIEKKKKPKPAKNYWKSLDLSDIKIAYIGDGNNVANSWILASALWGMKLSLACPPNHEPNPEILKQAKNMARRSGGEIKVVCPPLAAVKDADVIYTDVWTSMGQEEEYKKRLRDFAGYQLNKKLAARAKPDVLVMHCLPAHRGEEITDEVIDGPNSIVFDQAENRLHVQKAILLKLLS
ncbi:MAG: ornithine carbamoyltransferase [Elusimicrobiota bacterium]